MEEAQEEAAAVGRAETQVGDLPELYLSQAIARTSPRDACRCAAVSPAFCAAADSDHVWRAFLPQQLKHRGSSSRKKDAYLGLCDAASAVAIDGDGGRCRVWLERASGARCYALSARRLSLPWDDGEYSWRFKHHPRSRFAITSPIFFIVEMKFSFFLSYYISRQLGVPSF